MVLSVCYTTIHSTYMVLSVCYTTIHSTDNGTLSMLHYYTEYRQWYSQYVTLLYIVQTRVLSVCYSAIHSTVNGTLSM